VTLTMAEGTIELFSRGTIFISAADLIFG
jgi:hypothetical protein